MRVWRNTVVRFGLFAIPVGLAPLVQSKGIEGHRYDPETRERVRQSWTREDGTPVADTVTLYDVPDAAPIPVEVALDGETGVSLTGAVPIGDVDAALYDSAYILTPSKDAPKGLATLAAVLRDSGAVLVGTARFTSSLSAKSVVLRWSPLVGGIVLHTLHALDRVRVADAVAVTASLSAPTRDEYVQGEAFVGTLPDAFTPLQSDERDALIGAAIVAAMTANEEGRDEDGTAPADYLDALRQEVAARASTKDSEAVEA